MERYWPICLGTLRASCCNYPVEYEIYVIEDIRERRYVQGVRNEWREIKRLAAYLNKRESRRKEVKQLCTA